MSAFATSLESGVETVMLSIIEYGLNCINIDRIFIYSHYLLKMFCGMAQVRVYGGRPALRNMKKRGQPPRPLRG